MPTNILLTAKINTVLSVYRATLTMRGAVLLTLQDLVRTSYICDTSYCIELVHCGIEGEKRDVETKKLVISLARYEI